MPDVLGFVKKVAPWIASAAASTLPGPVGMAAKLVSNAIGKPVKADVSEIAAAVAGATPEQLAAIQQADQKFQLDMQKLGFSHEEELSKIAEQDRESARNRQIQLKDRIPAILAILVTSGFFGLLALMFKFSPPASNRDLLNIMLGSLGTAWIAIITFYFGSSKGSDDKNAIISNLSK